MPMRPALLVLLLMPLAPAQRVTCVPGGLAQAEGQGLLELPFSRGPSRTLILVDPALLGGLGSPAAITALGLRPDGGNPFAAQALTLEVVLSTGRTSPAAPQAEYAKNRGADAATVLPKVALSLPAAGLPSAPPSAVRAWLRFAKGFPYQGGPLCVEVASHAAPGGAWDVDSAPAAPFGFGRAVYEGLACPAGGNRIASAPVPWPGAPVDWKTRLEAATPGASAALLLLGAGLSTWGGQPLPWSLDRLLGTSGCTLYTDLVLGLAAAVSAGKAEVDMGGVPALAALEGASFTAQWLVPDPALAGGIGASALARVRLGQAPPCVTLYNYLVQANPDASHAEFLAAAMPVLFLEH